jgi:hypothetical protein
MRFPRGSTLAAALLAGGVTLILTFLTGKTPLEAGVAALRRLAGTEVTGQSGKAGRVSLASLDLGPVKDARSAAYDPIAVVGAGVHSRELFAAEVRDEPWAVQMEKGISKVGAARIASAAPRSRLTRVECRTAACLVEFRAPKEEFDDAFKALQSLKLMETCAPQCDEIQRKDGWGTAYVICFGRKARRADFARTLAQLQGSSKIADPSLLK